MVIIGEHTVWVGPASESKTMKNDAKIINVLFCVLIHSFTSCQLLVKGWALSIGEPFRLRIPRKLIIVVRISDRPDMASMCLPWT